MSPRTRKLALAALALLGPGLAVLLYEWLTWPAVGKLAQGVPKTTAFVSRYEERQAAAGKPVKADWRWVSYRQISNQLKHAVIVAEDIDFFSHHGFAWEEMKKAVEEARAEGEAPRGASTITQQLAKNLWLSPSRNPWRKVKEALLTRQLEAKLGKHRILELYLNVVEFGPGIYGAEAAARRYFGKSAAALDRHEAAALAGSLPKPSSWYPGSRSQVYARRVARIERRMERSGWVLGEL